MDEGKTQVSTNLACAIASSGKKVLIVDTDMRRRCIAGLLGIHTECGLYSVLVGQAPLKSAIYPTDRPNLYFMDSEPNIPSPPDVLSTKCFSALVDTLRDMFDYVIFDSPPIGLFVDAAIISNLVDGTLYVIRERAAKRERWMRIAEDAARRCRRRRAAAQGRKRTHLGLGHHVLARRGEQ